MEIAVADRTRFGQTFTILERYSNDPKKRKVIKEKLKTYNLRTRPKETVQKPKRKARKFPAFSETKTTPLLSFIQYRCR
ncbi:hypothetical protein LEP1GSC038_4850 [Leptospira weilii str. 2006001855]|uniref:Uncharacterized protein n=1 Tax=Leptospira weilii str. 2006001855 TaxID=996804 RepID=M6G0W2_9LEPT|nr:hypothetical protein LEP1GSC038_4850 [Leptospira weilii str. 2006001855]